MSGHDSSITTEWENIQREFEAEQAGVSAQDDLKRRQEAFEAMCRANAPIDHHPVNDTNFNNTPHDFEMK